jgi:phosphoglycerate dehydrogenase-like enzyme
VYDPGPASVPDGVRRCETLDELVPTSDILCLHVPLNELTTYISTAGRTRPGNKPANLRRPF